MFLENIKNLICSEYQIGLTIKEICSKHNLKYRSVYYHYLKKENIELIKHNNKGENNPNWRGGKIKYKCKNPNCKNILEAKRTSIINKKCKTYCSKECNNYHNKPKDIKQCKLCFRVYKTYKRNSIFCSISCKSKYNYYNDCKISIGVNRGNGGKKDYLNGLYVRSSYEANYILFLNLLITHGIVEKWEYEPKRFELIDINNTLCRYTPDFFVYYTNGNMEVHEVKGVYGFKIHKKNNFI